MQKKIMIIHGPNLNMLGYRESEIYTKTSLESINLSCTQKAQSYNIPLKIYQSNSEGDIINFIQESYFENYSDLIINAGAYTHTSIAIYDALKCTKANIYEVHLSNIYAREDFRHNSFISKIAKATLCGFQENSYLIAIDYIANYQK